MKKSFIILLIAALFFTLSCGVVAVAANAGSADDPVVTKSYVDNLVATLKADIKSEIGSQPAASTGGSAEYVVVEATNGQKIVGGASTEMILRSGTAKTFIPTAAGGGISDLTAGKDVGGPKIAGVQVSQNHLLLFPRADGRALVVTSEKAFVMIKGTYTIE